MKVLVADKFEQSGIDGLEAAGCDVALSARPEGRRAARRRCATRAPTCWWFAARRSPAPMLEAGSLVARRARRRRLQHHRRRRRLAPRHLRVQLPGQERHRGRRAHLRADPGPRPARARQRRRSARGTLEQEGILEGARALRPHARPARLRQHRPGSGQARARVRHADRRLEPPLRHREGSDREPADSPAAGAIAGRPGRPL